MSEHIGLRWVLRNRIAGLPKLSDFELVKEDLGRLENGEIIYKTEYVALDPYQRIYASKIEVMIILQIVIHAVNVDPFASCRSQLLWWAAM